MAGARGTSGGEQEESRRWQEDIRRQKELEAMRAAGIERAVYSPGYNPLDGPELIPVRPNQPEGVQGGDGLQADPSVRMPIGEDEIRKAEETFRKYRAAKDVYTRKVVNAEEWWKNNHWERFASDSSNSNDPRPVSAWLFNSVINKHADFMDNMPCPAILPREESDKGTAELLTQVVPKILEQNHFEEVYSACSWDKPKTGTGIYGVFWDQDKENGLGDIEIRQVDVINLFWQPGIEDIQKSRNLFSVDLVDRDVLTEQYPELEGEIGRTALLYQPEYIYDTHIDTSDKVQVIDWYYKKTVWTEVAGAPVRRQVLHYCKFIPGHVLFSSENEHAADPRKYAEGWYSDGKYPFVFDRLFPEKGMPVGFGYIEIMVNPQEYVDKLDQIILKHANLQRPRYFATPTSGVNLTDFADLSKDIVEVTGKVGEDDLRQIKPPQMSDVVLEARTMKIDEIKETSGNRDFSQGSTTSGVTAASAIAALQEAGSKLSRDMIKGTYTAFGEMVTMLIERMRQFYTLPRCYRITEPNGAERFVTMDNGVLGGPAVGMEGGVPLAAGENDLKERRPIFDISVSAQKASPYSRIANNELAKELYGMGVFAPENADQAMAVLEMMDFDKKPEVMKKVSGNGTMYQRMQQMASAMQQMAAVIARSTGDTRLLEAVPQFAAMASPEGRPQQVGAVPEGDMKVNSLGEAAAPGGNAAEQARQRVRDSTEVK